MKERPILFKGPQVRAILDGTKTQDRSLVDMSVPMGYIGPRGMGNDPESWGFEAEDGMWYVLARGKNDRCHNGMVSIPCPHGEIGDRLWVRETFAFIFDGEPPFDGGGPAGYFEYRADTDAKFAGEWPDDCGDDPECPRWKPSVHMPRRASRIDLEITEVRVQRLHDITEEDARAEGVKGDDISKVGVPCCSARQNFAQLWDAIHGARASWASNPWVWALTFKRIRP